MSPTATRPLHGPGPAVALAAHGPTWSRAFIYRWIFCVVLGLRLGLFAARPVRAVRVVSCHPGRRSTLPPSVVGIWRGFTNRLEVLNPM